MAETNEYWQSIKAEEVLEQRLWEKRSIWYNGEIHIYNMWKDGDKLYVSGSTEFGFIFQRSIPADSYVAIKLR